MAKNRINLYGVKQLLDKARYSDSLKAYLYSGVERFDASEYRDGSFTLRGKVGRNACAVSYEPRRGYDVYCDCGAVDFCRHTGALLIRYAQENGADGEELSDASASLLLSAYDGEETPSANRGTFSLLPVLSFEPGSVSASFRICGEKSYVILGLRAFARRMQEGEENVYGGSLRFSHDIRDLDERSQILCRMILNYAQGLNELLSGKKSDVVEGFGDVRSMPLSGETFDRIFELFLGEKLPCKDGGAKLLCQEDPQDLLDIRGAGGALTVAGAQEIATFESAAFSYIIYGRRICRVSDVFAKDVMPLLRGLNRSRGELTLSRRRAEEFCLTVAPRISRYLSGESLTSLKPFLPEELEVRYLLDMPERERMTCQPNFNYDGRYVAAGAPENAYPDIRRNFVKERAALRALEQYFDAPEPGQDAYTLTDEEKMYELIRKSGDALAEHGEVFISDRLRRLMSAKTPKPTVRAGVSHGMLNLTLDTDEFPVEELESLMRAVREKRKYYRLEDGSFLPLENGQFSAFTRISDQLGLNVRSLSRQGASLPLYKALFFDEAMKADRSVSVEKNADYRRLLRDFKTVEEWDFPLPEGLENVLRDYQKTGYTWLRTLDKYGFGGILADDMGLGKTLQVLAFLQGIRNGGEEGTALIACPASVVATWGSESQRWVPQMRVGLLTGGAAERAAMIRRAADFDLLVTSYDSLRNDIESHEKNFYRACVLDEAQYIKNRETKLKKSVDRLNARTRLALSGTPVENRLSELYSIFEFIMPGYLGSYTDFRRRFELPISESGDETARETLTKLVHPFILRRMKRDVLSELPPKTETNCYIQMGQEQRKLYIAYANEVKKKLESALPQDKLSLLAMLTRLRQICCDPALVYENYEQDSCKLDECVRMVGELIENEHRVLIFSQFTSMLARIGDALESQGIRAFTLQGDTPLEERVRLVNRFNAGENSVFLISLKAGGTGINLTGADTVIHFDPWWNIAAQNQATDRCYRIGQERPVQVYKLIASDTIEENIVKLQYKKLDLAKVVTENADGGLMNMDFGELMELLK